MLGIEFVYVRKWLTFLGWLKAQFVNVKINSLLPIVDVMYELLSVLSNSGSKIVVVEDRHKLKGNILNVK